MTSKSFLEQLYYGNISPMERKLNKNIKLFQLIKIAGDKTDKFRDKLSAEMQKEFDNLFSLKMAEACQMEMNGFIYGCRFVFRLLMSCMGDDNNDFQIEELLKLEDETI